MHWKNREFYLLGWLRPARFRLDFMRPWRAAGFGLRSRAWSVARRGRCRWGRRAAVEMVAADVAMFGPVLQHVVDRGQHRGGDRADGLFRAVLAAQAVELRLVIAVFLTAGRPGALDQQSLQPRRALAKTRGIALAGAFVLTGTQTRPGEKMAGGGKPAHVAAD